MQGAAFHTEMGLSHLAKHATVCGMQVELPGDCLRLSAQVDAQPMLKAGLLQPVKPMQPPSLTAMRLSTQVDAEPMMKAGPLQPVKPMQLPTTGTKQPLLPAPGIGSKQADEMAGTGMCPCKLAT